MKKTLLTVAMLGATLSVFAQGTIQFANRSTGTVIAPVYGVATNGPTDVQVRGNTAAGTPIGSQTYLAALLTGSGFTAELWGGTQGTAEGSLALLAGSSSTFRTGGFAGFWAAPAGAITIPGVPEGGIATLQVRVWDNVGGTILNWAAAQAVAHGSSALFLSTPLGGASLPPVLNNLTSFNLTSTVVPEPGTLALAGLGAASLLLFRRKK